MKFKHWQALWEVLSYLVSGVLLVINLVTPSFKHVAWFLVAEYLISMVNTLGWWLWVNSLEKK
jgi:hypothetical protein